MLWLMTVGIGKEGETVSIPRKRADRDVSSFLSPSSFLFSFFENARARQKERERKRKNSNGNPGATNLSSKRKSVGEAPGDIRILIRSELESRSRRFQPLGRLPTITSYLQPLGHHNSNAGIKRKRN